MQKIRNLTILIIFTFFSFLFFEVWLNLVKEYFIFLKNANGITDTIILTIITMSGLYTLRIMLLHFKDFVLLSISPMGGIVLLGLNYFLAQNTFHWELVVFWLIAISAVFVGNFFGMSAVEEGTPFFDLRSKNKST